jgi:hypothetical protein
MLKEVLIALALVVLKSTLVALTLVVLVKQHWQHCLCLKDALVLF